MKKYPLLSKIGIPLFLIIIISFLYFLSLIDIFPSPNSILNYLKDIILKYGVLVILIVSFIENLFGFNSYFPGAVIILTAMSLTKGKLEEAALTFLLIYFPVLIATCINYFSGQFIGIRMKVKAETKRSLRKKLLFTCWHPYLASITSFQSGFNQIPFKVFFWNFIPISLMWNLFWAIIAYNYGSVLTNNGDFFLIIFLVYLLVWIFYEILSSRGK